MKNAFMLTKYLKVSRRLLKFGERRKIMLIQRQCNQLKMIIWFCRCPVSTYFMMFFFVAAFHNFRILMQLLVFRYQFTKWSVFSAVVKSKLFLTWTLCFSTGLVVVFFCFLWRWKCASTLFICDVIKATPNTTISS